MAGFTYDVELSAGEWAALHNRQAAIHRWMKAAGMTIGSTLIVVDHNPDFPSKAFGGYESEATYTLHFASEDHALAFVTQWLA